MCHGCYPGYMSTPILKTLVADPNTSVDMSTHEHGLTGKAREIWDDFAQNPPYWWAKTDLYTVEQYCGMMGLVRELEIAKDQADMAHSFKEVQAIWSVMKSASIEIKNLSYALGLTPQARAAMKMAAPADQGDREKADEGEILTPEDL